MARAERTSTALVATAVLLAAALVFAQGASASRTTCALDPVTHVLSMELDLGGARGLFGEVSIQRAGDQITVSENLSAPPVPCGGTPTVTNTERIEVTPRGFVNVIVDLGGGALAPGVTAETDGSSEIEVLVTRFATVDLQGGSGADHFTFLTADGLSGVNVNPDSGDSDVDIGVSEIGQNLLPVIALGGPGPDTIEAIAPLAAVVAMDGEGGSDTLRATGADGSVLTGGKGRDQLFGSRQHDTLVPRRGPDTVQGSGGRDTVVLAPDGRRDTIACGGGNDLAGRPDPFDRLRSCERTAAGGNRR